MSKRSFSTVRSLCSVNKSAAVVYEKAYPSKTSTSKEPSQSGVKSSPTNTFKPLREADIVSVLTFKRAKKMHVYCWPKIALISEFNQHQVKCVCIGAFEFYLPQHTTNRASQTLTLLLVTSSP